VQNLLTVAGGPSNLQPSPSRTGRARGQDGCMLIGFNTCHTELTRGLLFLSK
jgi:hypothetical protein